MSMVARPPKAESGLGNAVVSHAQGVWDVATSKRTQRTVLQTIILALASAIIFGLSVISYIAFYNAYLPDQITALPIHLQYGYEVNPYGVASLAAANLKDLQDYDISITLFLPRSPSNLELGNFMLAVYLLDDSIPPPIGTAKILSSFSGGSSTGPSHDLPTTQVMQAGPQSVLRSRHVVHTAARPVIIPYTDPLISLASRILFIPWHIFSPRHAETVKVTVPVVEALQFRSGRTTMPTTLVLDLQAGQTLQVYNALVTVTAQLHGLRWIMYKWWLSSFLFFVGTFWGCATGVMILAWALIGSGSGNNKGKQQDIPIVAQSEQLREEPRIKAQVEVEDVPMTFPTTSGQPPLRYEPAHVKQEELKDEQTLLLALPNAGAEADDEEEEFDEYRGKTEDELIRLGRDSGIGTSYSDGNGPSLLRRRSKGGR